MKTVCKLKDLDIDECPVDFSECEVIYTNDWSSYEEHGWIVIFKFFDEIFVWEYEYSVFAESNDVIFDPYTVGMDEVDCIKVGWDAKGGWNA